MGAKLAQYIQKNHPEIKGFDKKNLYRMVQFYQLHRELPIVAPLARQLQNSDNQGEMQNKMRLKTAGPEPYTATVPRNLFY